MKRQQNIKDEETANNKNVKGQINILSFILIVTFIIYSFNSSNLFHLKLIIKILKLILYFHFPLIYYFLKSIFKINKLNKVNDENDK